MNNENKSTIIYESHYMYIEYSNGLQTLELVSEFNVNSTSLNI